MAGLDESPQIYPSIRQSWAILGIVILLAIAFSPLMILKIWIGDEAATMVYYITAFGLAFLIVHSIRKRRQGSSSYRFSLGSWRLVFPLSLGSVALLFGVISPIAGLIPMHGTINKAMHSLAAQKGVLTFIYFVIAAPLLEELIFRGIMLDGLLKRYKPVTAILVSSSLFGLAHLNPWQFVTGFLLGGFMGWVYLRSHSVGACIVMHMSANFSGYLVRLLVALHPEAWRNGIPGPSGAGPLRFVAFTAPLVAAVVFSVYWLRREFDTHQYV
jgi:membrane protease YdiL (CAAX protease family)